jgi:pyrroline-5-carboxylate reductase
MTQKSLGLAGAGRMGTALLDGWANARGHGFARAVSVFEPQPGPAAQAAIKTLGAQLNPAPNGVLDALVLAVKPQIFAEAAPALKPLVGPGTLVVSIMAGVTSAALKQKLGAARVVRAMPNTPGAIGKGITGYAASDLSAEDRAEAEALLAPLGAVERVPNESDIDAVTAVSGSGPAYVFFLVEALAAAGEAEGLDKATALKLARQTVAGAGALLDASDEPADALRRAVTSPGGTTAAALDVLMAEGGLAALMRRAVRAAAARSRELGK